MVVEMIEEHCRAQAEARETKQALGAHNAGQCPRKNWYLLHGAPQESLEHRAIRVFDLGNRVEDSLLEMLIAGSGGRVGRADPERDKVFVEELGGRVIPDAFLAMDDELVIVECKSMSDFAFDRLERGEVEESYLDQVEVYLRAYNARRGVLLGYRKQTSHIAEKEIWRDDARWQRIQASAAAARGDEVPPRPYSLIEDCEDCGGSGKTPGKGLPHKACNGTGKLPWGPCLPQYPCGYCAYKAECWGALEIAVTPKGKPVWRQREAH